MRLDLLEVDGVAETGRLEQVPRVPPQRRELGQLPAVALEVAVVDGVEPHEGREEADVGLRDRVPDQIAPVPKPLLQPFQPVPQPPVRLVVRLLAARETALVDAVVDVPVHLLGHVVDLVAPLLRIELRRAVPLMSRPLAAQVERDLREVVGHHRAGGDVDDRGHGDPARVGGVPPEERLLEPFDPEDRVPAVRVQVEGPTALVVHGPRDAHRQDVLQAHEAPDDRGPVRPRARAGDDQPVPSGLHGIPVPAVGRDPRRDVVPVALVLTVASHGHERSPLRTAPPGISRRRRPVLRASPAGPASSSRRRRPVPGGRGSSG